MSHGKMNVLAYMKISNNNYLSFMNNIGYLVDFILQQDIGPKNKIKIMNNWVDGF